MWVGQHFEGKKEFDCHWLLVSVNCDCGLLLLQLFSDIVPKTCANFRALCTGECGESPSSEFKLHYDGSIIHRIVPNGWIQGGGMCHDLFGR